MPRSLKKGPFVDLHLLKKVEKAVLSTILGKEVKNKDALSNPKSLREYSNLSF